MRTVTKEELAEIIAKHGKWLREDRSGERANLRHASLSFADLRNADLSHTDLRHAILRGAKGFYLLPVQDPRGYSFPHAVLTDTGWRIRAGCRDFSLTGAREHWGTSYKGERWIGDMYLHACDWLESMTAEQSEEAA